ncbi:MinD/ParA family protein [Sediminibacillus albus]|nr:MinD/ParA family protein [Sediminibacillus albus]
MNDQAENLRRKIEVRRNFRQAKTIAIVSGKGGVGKSNFALNFSLGLTLKDKKVLIFDLDIGMGNIDILLGKSSRLSIVNMFEDKLSIHDIIETAADSLSYISAGSGLSDIFTMDKANFDYFTTQFEELASGYDFIIFDMGAGITEGTAHFLMATDECIVVTTPEPTSLTDAYAMIKHISMKDSTIPLRLLVNRAQNRKSGIQTGNRLQQVVNRFLDRELLQLGVLPDDKAVVQAVTGQSPFMLYNQKSNVARAMVEIVDRFLGEKDRMESTTTDSRSFINKLKQFIKER